MIRKKIESKPLNKILKPDREKTQRIANSK